VFESDIATVKKRIFTTGLVHINELTADDLTLFNMMVVICSGVDMWTSPSYLRTGKLLAKTFQSASGLLHFGLKRPWCECGHTGNNVTHSYAT
jgi:hypothetical protein